jgi:hypothetical protein
MADGITGEKTRRQNGHPLSRAVVISSDMNVQMATRASLYRLFLHAGQCRATLPQQ